MGRRERVELDESGRPVLITDAETSFEDQHRARVRKYMLIMSVRIPALLLAAVAYAQWANPWVSLTIIGASIPLPWIAVLIANDRPPRTADEPRRYERRRTEIASTPQRAIEGPVIDSEPDDPPSGTGTSGAGTSGS